MTTEAAILSSTALATPATRAARARLDARACPVGTGSQAAIEHAETALWRLVSFFGDPLADLDAAIAQDPNWVLAHVMRADALLSMTEHGMADMAAQILRHADALVEAGHGNERERRHLAAAQLCAGGHWLEACAAWDELLVEHPQDLLALWMAHLFDFARGDARNLHRRVARVLPDWSAAAPLHGFVLGMYSFGLEENQLYPQALDAGQAALARDPRNPWALHAVTHVHEMLGQMDQGIRWLETRTGDWAHDNGFAYHNWWHLALYYLEQGHTVRVLQLLDDHIEPGAQTALQRIDITALLWRLRLLGVDTGDRFTKSAQGWPHTAPEAGFYAFNDMHALMANIGAGRMEEASQVLAAAEHGAHQGASMRVQVMRGVGVPLMRALLAYARGQYKEAAGALLSLRERWVGFGGSHAQRDMLELTLLDASVRAGEHRQARRLLNERQLAKRQSAVTGHWAARMAG